MIADRETVHSLERASRLSVKIAGRFFFSSATVVKPWRERDQLLIRRAPTRTPVVLEPADSRPVSAQHCVCSRPFAFVAAEKYRMGLMMVRTAFRPLSRFKFPAPACNRSPLGCLAPS